MSEAAPAGSVLRLRDFRLVLVAWGVSMFGDFLAVIALVLRVEEATDSAFAVAALLFASGVPATLLAPLTGWLVDRVETTRLLAATAAAQTAVATALVVFESPGATIALALLLGCGLAIEGPALFSLVPRIVGPARAPRANAWLEAARYVGLTFGTLTGGVVTGAVGSQTALALDAGTFAVACGAALALRVRRAPARPLEESGWGQVMAGLGLLARDRVLRTAVLVLGAAVTLAAATNVAEVFYAKDELDAGDAGYGALAAAWGVGMVAGALAIGRRLTGSTAALAVATGTLVTGLSLISAALAGALVLALAIFVAGGAANGTENVAMRTLIHARVADGLWGRAYAAYHGAMTAAEFTAFAIGGLLVEATGPRETMAIAGAGALLAGLAGALRLLR